MNIRELIERKHIKTGEPRANIRKKIGYLLYPNATPHSQKLMVSEFVKGSRQGIKFVHIKQLCKILDCNVNELFSEYLI